MAHFTMVVFGSFLISPTIKKRCQSWTPFTKLSGSAHELDILKLKKRLHEAIPYVMDKFLVQKRLVALFS